MSAERDATRRLADRVAKHRPGMGRTVIESVWPLGAGILLAFLLQVLVAPAVGDFYAKLLLDVGIAIVLAVSLNIVNGFAGQFSIGHAGFMLVGGYTAAYITYYGSIAAGWVTPDAYGVDVHGPFMGGGDLLFLLSCVVGGVVAALAGLLVGLPSLRLRGDYLAIVTLGFGEVLRVLVLQTKSVLGPEEAVEQGMLAAVDNLGGPLGFTGTPTYVSPTPWKVNAAGEQTGHAGIFFVFVFVAIVVLVAYRLKYSSKGRALLAVRENEIAAEAMGIDTARAKVVAFVTSAFFAGIGGGLFAHTLGVTLNPKELGFQKSIDLVIMVVIGGMGSITGVVVAATILTLLPEIFREFAQYRMPVYALALILVMILRPNGLMGIKELWELRPAKRDVIIGLSIVGGGIAIRVGLRIAVGLMNEVSDKTLQLLTAFDQLGMLAIILGAGLTVVFAAMIAVRTLRARRVT